MYTRFMQLLQEKDITAYRVSKETGVTQTTLSDWKTGRATPKTATLQKIADYFGVSLDWLTGKSKYRNNQEYMDFNWGPVDPYFDAPFDFAGEILKPLREKKGVSAAEIGNNILECGEDLYAEMEEGTVPMCLCDAQKVCAYLGTNISQLLFDNDLYDGEVPEQYHNNVIEWEKLKELAEEESKKEKIEVSDIANPDIRMIARAGKKMTPEQAQTLRKYAQFMFPEAFND